MLVTLRPAAALAVVASLFAARVHAIPRVTRTGRYLYQEDGTRFYIKGIAYQEQGEVIESDDNHFLEPSTFVDPLAIPAACTRDVEYLRQASINTIRVYSVNSSLNHDDCMRTFSDAGIYTIIDLALPMNGSIDRLAPSWSSNLLDQYLRTIDVFSQYDNVLAYNIGNEVVLGDSTQIAPYVKAAARDTKAYLQSKGLTTLVGYAAINGASTFRNTLADYLSCGSEGTAIDLYGLNDYSWCGDSSFEGSYSGITTQFADYNVVAYLSEYGCISSPPRLWTESTALFSAQMSDVWSGGIAFSYFPAASAAGQFGMVTVSADGNSITTSADWDRLVTQYGANNGPNTPAQGSAAASTYPTCPSETTFLGSNTLPPTPNESACGCLESALSCQFTPATRNYSVVVGELINTGCSLLGEAGGSCLEIGGDGQTGVYGRVSACDPTIKLSYIMSQYYEAEGRNAQACDFAGNGTVNSGSTAAAAAAASSCIASPSATFVPSAPPTLSGGGPASTNTRTSGGNNGNGGNSGNSNNNSGAVSLVAATNALIGVAAMGFVGVASAVWTLV
ncbi:hypothetical protein EST38_g2014 [Candolleomyces aberdarensis]|uniref:1,3-beta-glucanosyltransferase n=1 Tax=Candolleomyces aberdarensis TaxID=2316362 RepID=A0A4Q2DUQ0_9AGAR|nr:hypothetical protein EST38_g2014 [Candolleomyces aberdarensis]